MKSRPNTLDKLIKYYEQSTIDSHICNQKITGINDFNNVEKADRKLIINNQLEFWVHDKILNDNCNFFLKLNINSNKDNNLINNNKNDKNIVLNKNLYLKKNASKCNENKIRSKKYKIEIQLPNNKRNNFTKQNSKDLCSKIYRKIHNINYNTCSTISSEKNENIVNNNSASIKTKTKKKLSIQMNRKSGYINNKNRNIKNILNKSYITEDLNKIQKLKEIIKKRKLALSLMDNFKSIKNKTPDKNINKKTINPYPILKHFKKINLERENAYIKNNYIINKYQHKNTTNKKTYINKIKNNNMYNMYINHKKNELINDSNNKQTKMKIYKESINSNSNILIKNDFNECIKITEININDKNEFFLFFDVLVWMYTKDIKKLKKFSKNFDILINLLSLAHFLKMKKKFYNALLTTIDQNFDIAFFNSIKWTKNKISFYALEKIIPLLNGNYNRIYALISWLKPINTNRNKISHDNKIIKDIIKTKEFFLVRNYIKKYKLIYNLSREEIIELKNKFYYFIDCLDIEGIFDNYILSQNDIICILCNRSYNSVYLIINEEEGSNNDSINIYFPPKILNGQYRQNNILKNNQKINSDLNKSINKCKHLFMIKNTK